MILIPTPIWLDGSVFLVFWLFFLMVDGVYVRPCVTCISSMMVVIIQDFIMLLDLCLCLVLLFNWLITSQSCSICSFVIVLVVVVVVTFFFLVRFTKLYWRVSGLLFFDLFNILELAIFAHFLFSKLFDC